jgi:hypothetical protein
MALSKFRSILQNTNSVEGDTMQGRTRGEASESGGGGFGKMNISKENIIFRCQQMLG